MLQHISEHKVAAANVVKHTIQNHPDSHGMGFLYHRFQVVLSTHLWIDLVVIKGIIPMI